MRTTKRLAAIDCFRALTMYLMIFVNDVAGVINIPKWLGHTQAQEDGMGFADTIFPAFLFIVGLSLPHAIGSRLNKGQSFLQIGLHLLLRSAALIIMGFYHVNLENYSSAAMLPRDVWALIVTAAFFLTWLDYPKTMNKFRRYILIGCGIVLLLLMAYVYKGGDPKNPHGMRPEWWGILGIIGWAYLVCSLVYLLVKDRLLLLMAITIVFLLINIAAHSGYSIDLPVLDDASSATLIMAGTIMGVLYGRFAATNRYRPLWLLLPAIAAVMIIAGFIVRPYAGGISKIMATPAWVLICSGISVLAFVFVTWLTDRQRKENWFRLIRPAGTSTLTCYLLPYIVYAVYGLTGFRYPSFFNEGIGGIIRSLVIALLVILLVGQMEKIRLKLKI
jgi:heparan-alpha-glucosaminide N-acetyltransferase